MSPDRCWTHAVRLLDIELTASYQWGWTILNIDQESFKGLEDLKNKLQPKTLSQPPAERQNSVADDYSPYYDEQLRQYNSLLSEIRSLRARIRHGGDEGQLYRLYLQRADLQHHVNSFNANYRYSRPERVQKLNEMMRKLPAPQFPTSGSVHSYPAGFHN